MCWSNIISSKDYRKSTIAARVGVSRRTLYHWLATGKLDRAVDAPVRYPPRPTKLDPYKAIILERLDLYPDLMAVRLDWLSPDHSHRRHALLSADEPAL